MRGSLFFYQKFGVLFITIILFSTIISVEASSGDQKFGSNYCRISPLLDFSKPSCPINEEVNKIMENFISV